MLQFSIGVLYHDATFLIPSVDWKFTNRLRTIKVSFEIFLGGKMRRKERYLRNQKAKQKDKDKGSLYADFRNRFSFFELS